MPPIRIPVVREGDKARKKYFLKLTQMAVQDADCSA